MLVRNSSVSQSDIENVNPFDTLAFTALTLFYYFRVEQVNAPPVQLSQIPLIFTGSATASGIGRAEYNGFFGVLDNNGITQGIEYVNPETDV